MTKLDIRISEAEVHDNFASYGTSNRVNITIRRKDKKMQTSYPAYLRMQPDLSDILLEIRAILLDLDSDHNFKEFCKHHGLSVDDSSNKLRYRQQVKTAKALSRMFSEEELASLPTSSSLGDKLKKDLNLSQHLNKPVRRAKQEILGNTTKTQTYIRDFL